MSGESIAQMKLLKRVLKGLWANDWMPSDLFQTCVSSEWIEYKVPDISLFGTSTGYLHSRYEQTDVGEWMDGLPGWLALLLLSIYYPVAYLSWMMLWPVVGLVKSIVLLLTVRWGDFKR